MPRRRPRRVIPRAMGTLTIVMCALALTACRQDRDAVSFERTPERLARGRYLTWGPPHCVRCHSELLTDVPGTPPKPGREFAGFQNAAGRVSPNLTPDAETGAGAWTDAELVRAIRQGIGHDGRRLSPPMPWNLLSVLSDEDVKSIVVYLRSLPVVRNPLPPNVEPRIEELIQDRVTLAPPVAPAISEFKDDLVRRGAYLARIGDCVNCHTPFDGQGHRMVSYRFGGGRGDAGVAANLTSDPSGLAYYDADVFIQAMRTGKVGGVRAINDRMPWWYVGHLTDDDLRAVFAYLRTVPPVSHRVNTFDEETLCPICGEKHGLGSLNVARPHTAALR